MNIKIRAEQNKNLKDSNIRWYHNNEMNDDMKSTVLWI